MVVAIRTFGDGGIGRMRYGHVIACPLCVGALTPWQVPYFVAWLCCNIVVRLAHANELWVFLALSRFYLFPIGSADVAETFPGPNSDS